MRIWRREWWLPSDDIHYPPYKCWLPSQPDSVCSYSFCFIALFGKVLVCLFVLSFLHSFVWQGVHLLVSRPTWRRLSKLRSLLFRRMRQHLRRRWRCNQFFFDRCNYFFVLLVQQWFNVVRHLAIPSRIHGAEAPTANNCYYSWLQLWRAKGIKYNTGRICFWWQKLHLSFDYA